MTEPTDIPMTLELRRRLRAERKRTGLSPKMLLIDRLDLPSGLAASHISRWESGITRAAPKFHVDYVLTLWSAVRDDAGRIDENGQLRKRPGRRHARGNEEWIDVTPEMGARLHSAMIRSGYAARAIAEHPDRPPELSARMVNSWIYGESKKARKSCWDFVADLCGVLDEFAQPMREMLE